jgi:COP9 signalosome complex subunit 2
MSDNDDDEDDYEYSDNDNNMEEENLQYTDDEEEQDDTAVALENAYYNAKGNRTVESFEQVIQLEASTSINKPGIWTFKAMKQLVKLHLRQNNHDPSVVIAAYERLLTCVASPASEISPAAVEKGIGSMLDRVGSGCDPIVARSVYDATLKVFHPESGPCQNERLWFKTNLKYGQSLFQAGEWTKLHNVVLKELTSHETTSTNTMEIFALQMQLYEVTDTKKLRETFQKAMAVRGGIPHPRTIALIQGTCIWGVFVSNCILARCVSHVVMAFQNWVAKCTCKLVSMLPPKRRFFKPLNHTMKRVILVV